MKPCTKCGATKGLAAFPAAGKKRRSSWCRACHSAAANNTKRHRLPSGVTNKAEH